MGFFDFLADIPPYDTGKSLTRLNKRYALIVAPFAEALEGARVLDLAAHDGRWSYALAGAGARQVIGVEARGGLFARFARYPETAFKSRVELREGDVFEALEQFGRDGETFDVVAVYGILYHIMDHFRLFRLIRALRPGMVIVDSEFMTARNPMIQLTLERTEFDINAAPQVDGQEKAIIGIPSRRAMEKITEVLGFRCDWVDVDAIIGGDRSALSDYFRDGAKRRGTCVLFPEDGPA
ncbi:MAG: class I SAM-dependent methyltransferase [Rhodobacter sp.]|nr:class I SAM-dependent methyltransferase [Rhodobacter sp.]